MMTSLIGKGGKARILLTVLALVFVFLFVSSANALYVADKKMCRSQPSDSYCSYSDGYYDAQDEIWFFYRTYSLGGGGNFCNTPSMYTPWGDTWTYSANCWYLNGYYDYYWWWSHWYGADNGYTWYPGSYTAHYSWTYPGYSGSFEYYFTIKGLTVNAQSTCSSQPTGDSCASNNGHYRTTDTVWLFWRTWWVNHRDGCYNVDVSVNIDGPNGIHWTYSPWNFNGCDGNYDYRWWWWSWSAGTWTPGTYTAHYTITDKKVYNYAKSFDISWTIDTPDCSVYNGCSNGVIKQNCRYDAGSAQCVCDTLTMPNDGDYCKDTNNKEFRDYTGCSGYNWVYSSSNVYDCNNLNNAGVNYTCKSQNLYKVNYSNDYDCSNGLNQAPGAICNKSASSWVNETFVEDCNLRDGLYCNGNTLESRDYGCSISGPNASCTYSVTSSQNCTFGCGYINSSAVCKTVNITAVRAQNVDANITVRTNYTSYGIGGDVKFVVDIIKWLGGGNCVKLWCANPANETECSSCLDGHSYVVNVTANTRGTLTIPIQLTNGMNGVYNVRVTALNGSNVIYSSAWAPENLTFYFFSGLNQPIGFVPKEGSLEKDNAGGGLPTIGLAIALIGTLAGTVYIGINVARNSSGISTAVNSLRNGVENAERLVATIVEDFSASYSDSVPEAVSYTSITYAPPQDEDRPVLQPRGNAGGAVYLPPVYTRNYNVNYGSPPVVPPYTQLPGYRPPGISPNDPYQSDFYEMLRNMIYYYLSMGYSLGYITTMLTNQYNVSSSTIYQLAASYNSDGTIVSPGDDSSNDGYYYGIVYSDAFWAPSTGPAFNANEEARKMGFTGLTDGVNWLKDVLEGPLENLSDIPWWVPIVGQVGFSIDVMIGFLDGAAQTAEGIINFIGMLIRDPAGTFQTLATAIWDALTHLPETLMGIWNYFKEEVDQGHPGRAVGKAIFEILTFIVTPAKIAEAAGLSGKIAKVMEMMRMGRITSETVHAVGSIFNKFSTELVGETVEDLSEHIDDLIRAGKLSSATIGKLEELSDVGGAEIWLKRIRAAGDNVGNLRGIEKEIELAHLLKSEGYTITRIAAGSSESATTVSVRLPKNIMTKYGFTKEIVDMEVDITARSPSGRWSFIESKSSTPINLDESFKRQIVKYKYLAETHGGDAIIPLQQPSTGWPEWLRRFFEDEGFKFRDGQWIYSAVG